MHISSLIAGSMLASYVAGHALIISLQGLVDGKNAGPMGQALGYDRAVPLNGQDLRHVPIFDQRSIATWNGCGKNILTGTLQPSRVVAAQAGRGEIAQAMAGGQLFMVLHQVNGDGNGPFTCAINTDGTAKRGSFKKVDIAKQVPGQNPDLNAVSATNHPLIVNLPANLECTGTFGTKEKVCIIRCQNFAINGPFGSCAAFQLVDELKSLFRRGEGDDAHASVKAKRQEEAGPEKKEPEVGKGATEADIARLMAGFDTTTKKVKRQEEAGPEKREPEVGKGASEADIKKLMSSFDTSTKMVKRETSEAEKVEDTVKALTQGDAVPEKQLNKLRTQVKQRIRNGTLANKAEEAGRKYHEKKVRLRKAGSWKNKSKPAEKKGN
ncbi:hypothetical protein TWF569_003916 [Orbilia oligospora]|uniref:Uncharacterized protein n=1 Tax=Orbilia oligospora TaxID=2813651 RepID=A0A7C8NQ42_ORBOL|nr:hypothetical protein TWF102_005380 [Orbilia oligospora]KAF3107691.1 hypothetical protein TWF706_002528 [Orbilia oligospora]KAF3114160.1 hypothetical protein TWF103_001580 [Orbilia oligospora]KAF3136608.1 hypothetical protein TWF594_007866 [Orbilia oligospora]KAF3156996.1 hypothetical protein TWF569_003916 [Orbilia oligospora]